MPKKIGIDIRCLLEKNRSGVGEYTYNLLDTLFQTCPREGGDQKNEYFLFYNSFHSTAQRVEPFEKWNYPNVHFCGFKFPNKLFNAGLKFFKYPKVDKLIFKTLRLRSGNMGSELDIFLMPNLNFISLSPQCKKIVIAHDLSYEIYPEFFSLKSRVWHKIINPKKLYRDADQIIAVSENTAKDLNDIYNIPQDKIKVIYPGVKKQTVSELDLTRVKQKYNLPENCILYLGNIEPRKNIEGMLQAFKILKSAKTQNFSSLQLVIAGSLGYKYQHFCKNRCENVQFLGYVPNEDKAALYKLAKLFVFPSFYEGFGFPPLEAMAQGTPVVSSISSSLVEVIGDAGLLVDPYNINELAWAINEIIDNEKLRNELIEKGYERIKMFSWEKTAEKIIGVIKYPT